MADPKGFMKTPRQVAERRPVQQRIHAVSYTHLTLPTM